MLTTMDGCPSNGCTSSVANAVTRSPTSSLPPEETISNSNSSSSNNCKNSNNNTATATEQNHHHHHHHHLLQQHHQRQQQQQRDTTTTTTPTVSSPKQADSSCAKRPSSKSKYSSRHMPYPEASARSPGSCSSDGGDSSTQSDGDSQEDPTRIQFKVKRIQANSRERKRMHTVNSAFDQLRELVPTYPSNRKLSKIDTLRLACTYIQDLVSLLHSTQAIGEDVLYNSQHHQPQAFGPDTFTAGYPVAVKQELSEQFPGFTDQFRMQPACLRFAADCESFATGSSATSESETVGTHSPPQAPPPPVFMQCPPPPNTLSPSRPPPLTRVSSGEGTTSIHTRMAEATISGPSPLTSLTSLSTTAAASLPLPPPPPPPPPPSTSIYQRQVNVTSPLAMHSVTQHSSPLPSFNGLMSHHTTQPVWQRTASMPNGFPVYGQ